MQTRVLEALRLLSEWLPRWAVSTPRRAISHSLLAVHEGAPCWVGEARSRDERATTAERCER
eukprot:3377698-Prymnesium_polylepis.1